MEQFPESITIKNFGGLESVFIPLNNVNIFIGKQGVGKSVTVKLIFYFKSLFMEIFDGVQDGKTKTQIDKDFLTKFSEYFPPNSWPDKKFEIKYQLGDNAIHLKKIDRSKITITYSDGIKKQFTNCRRIIGLDKKKFEAEDKFEIYRPGYGVKAKYISILQKEIMRIASFNQIFIPAGRSFFANLQSSIFSFLSSNKAVDPFLVKFGSFYESIKATYSRRLTYTNNKSLTNYIVATISEILGGKYLRENGQDFVLHEDRRKVNLSNASSGQQETLPLTTILATLLNIRFIGGGATLFIEEPEAHLFPEAQRKIVELLATVMNNADAKLQIFITTHSPYILTSFNNLMYAGLLYGDPSIDKRQLNRIISSRAAIPPYITHAFAMQKGNVENLIDSDSKLIRADYLDNVSNEIALQFDSLLNLN